MVNGFERDGETIKPRAPGSPSRAATGTRAPLTQTGYTARATSKDSTMLRAKPLRSPGRLLQLALLGLVLQLGAGHAAQAAGLPLCPITDGLTQAYDIVRGGNVIGRHTLQFGKRGGELTVTITVEANLFALGIRVYHYEHRSKELWRDGAMVGMQSVTKDDGDTKQVNASLDPARGTWSGTAGSAVVSGPLMASSFWNSDTVRQTRFLDDETGAVTPVKVTPAGQEILALGGRAVPASKFDLVGTMTGSVWYDGSGCWVRALFKSPLDGSMVEVRPRG